MKWPLVLLLGGINLCVVRTQSIPFVIDSTKPKPQNYTPDWDSLDSRPNPAWYDSAKFGIFLHWGVYSVPTHGNEWFWTNVVTQKPDYVAYMQKNFKPGFTYQEFAKDFTAENFDPNEWVEIFKASGAKYVVLTSKHHDGFTLWPSRYSFSWNAVDVGPHRDLVGELAKAIRKNSNLVYGLYHSLFEWYNPMYLSDLQNSYKTQEFVDKKVIPEMIELVVKYKPQVLWSDGDWMVGDSYWRAKEFLTWLFNASPVKDTVVVNDRWGKDSRNKHGGVWTGQDHWNPGKLQAHKWENAMTVDKSSWGYRPEASLEDYRSTQELINELVSTVSCGGNLLLNVGPSKNGKIAPIFEQRLKDIGGWLKVNGEAIYDSQPWANQNDTKTKNVWYTMKNNGKRVFAILLTYPESNQIDLYSIREVFTANTKVKLLGHNEELKTNISKDFVTVFLPSPYYSLTLSSWAWTLEFNN